MRVNHPTRESRDACRLFSHGVIFPRARVSLALLIPEDKWGTTRSLRVGYVLRVDLNVWTGLRQDMIIGQPRPQGLLVFQYGGVSNAAILENEKTLGRGQIIM